MVQDKKNEIQDEALQTWVDNKCVGALAMATGSGKSKVALLAIDYIVKTLKVKKPKICLIVPTESLRDHNWLEEFKKWKEDKLADEHGFEPFYLDNLREKKIILK